MAQYQTPNVYVKKDSPQADSVADVATSIPAFIGYTELTQDRNDRLKSWLNVPVRVTSMAQYEAVFGGVYAEALALSYDQATGDFYILEQEASVFAKFFLYQAVSHFFSNGGEACWVTSIGNYHSQLKSKQAFAKALDAVEKVDEVTLLVLPESVTLEAQDHYDLHNAALAQASKLQDRFALMDVKQTSVLVAKVREDAALMREKVQGDLKYGAAYYPYLRSTMARSYDETTTVVNLENGHQVRLADLNDPSHEDASTAAYDAVQRLLRKHYLLLPPSAAVAGAIAQTDALHGVWKAPANVPLANVLEPMVMIDDSQQENLNVDTIAGKSINAIRAFVGKGNLIWGARTLAGNDLEWRYVSVRRLFTMVEESLSKATAFAVFESNSAITWLKLKMVTQNYLRNLWKQGALVGEVESQAFFVLVGLGESMTEQDILAGLIKIKIGLAATRPGEFIELTFAHQSLTS